MRANRLIHALTVSNPGGHFWDDVYSRVPERPEGIPFNILLTYYYLRLCSGRKSVEAQAELTELHRGLTNGGILLIDSGVYSLNVQHGVDIRSYNVTTSKESLDNIADVGKGSLQIYIDYVDGYADFLKASEAHWDYAFDFDADIFLGSVITDELHERLVERSGLPRDRFIRVYHLARSDVTTWWKNLCKDDRYEVIAIEGGTTHKRNPAFYRPLVELAHTHGKKVHVLAASSLPLIQDVAIDMFDSTTHLSGGRFGNLFTPFGAIDFSRMGIKPPAYGDLPPDVQKELCAYLEGMGLSLQEIIDSPYSRNLANIWYMNTHWDVEYIEKEQSISLFDILEA